LVTIVLRSGCSCLAILLIALLAGCSSKGPVVAAGPPVAPVTVAPVVERTAPIDVQVIGNVEAYETISVKSQIGGVLERVSIHEGDFVKKDEPLVEVVTADKPDELRSPESEARAKKQKPARAIRGTVFGRMEPRFSGRVVLNEQPAERPGIARVAREQRALDRLGQVDQREHRTIDIREVRLEPPALCVCERLDRVLHGRLIVAASPEVIRPRLRPTRRGLATAAEPGPG